MSHHLTAFCAAPVARRQWRPIRILAPETLSLIRASHVTVFGWTVANLIALVRFGGVARFGVKETVSRVAA